MNYASLLLLGLTPFLVTANECRPRSISLTDLAPLISRNHELALAQNAIASARADGLAANRAPYPTLSLKTSSIDLHNGLGPGLPIQKRIDKGVGLDFTYERANKRALRTQNADALTRAIEFDRDDLVITQEMLASAAFIDLAAAQARETAISEIAEQAKQLASINQTRAKLGDIAAQDAARAEIEYQKALLDLNNANLERSRASLALSALLDTEACPDTWHAKYDWPNTQSSLPKASDLALEARPDIRANLARLDASDVGLALAQASKAADINYGISYDHYPSNSKALIELRVSVPLMGIKWLNPYQQEGEIAKAHAQKEQAEILLRKQRHIASLEHQKFLSEQAALRLKQRHYEDTLLPAQRQVLRTAEQAYRIGGLPLSDVIDSRRQLKNLMLEALGTDAELAKSHLLAMTRFPSSAQQK